MVGQAELIETDSDEIPFCISAATMRVTMAPAVDSVNVYLAARAVFHLLKNESRIERVTISGIVTGAGQVSFDVCARQMKKAYTDIWLGKYVFPFSWNEAKFSHQLLYSDGYIHWPR